MVASPPTRISATFVALAISCAIGAFLVIGEAGARAQDIGDWASTPPMGWNSWDVYGATVVEDEVRSNADYMATNLKQFGWEYVVVDIRWTVQNSASSHYNSDAIFTLDDNGRFLPAPNRFPSSASGDGFKPLADYIHSLGLKFGIHIMRGVPKVAVDGNYPIANSNYTTGELTTSAGAPWLNDMWGIEASDAGQAYYDSIFQLYADWDVDYVKIDDMAYNSSYHAEELSMVRQAIDNTGREMVLSLSPGFFPLSAGPTLASESNLWRITGDVWDTWNAINNMTFALNNWNQYRSEGHWPDADMLPLGRIGIRAHVGSDRMTNLTHDEQRTMMSLWSIARSPLMFGGDLPSNDAWTLDLITNPEVLAVNQHSSNNHQLYRDGDQLAWVADNPDGGKYVAMFNLASSGIEFATLKSLANFVSPVITRETPGQSVSFDVDITNKNRLYLLVDDGGDAYNADWADWVDVKLNGPGGSISLTDLNWLRASTGFGEVGDGVDVLGGPLEIDGTTYTDGLGTHAKSLIEYILPTGFTSLTGIAGLDDSGATQLNLNPSIQFAITVTEEPVANFSVGEMEVSLADLGFTGAAWVRDLWARSDLGLVTDQLSQAIPVHGSGLYLITSASELPGDFNNDGTVDAADYVVWRKSLGSTTLLAADGDGNRQVGYEDYEMWRSHFGESVGGAGEVAFAAVPEPGTGLLLTLAIARLAVLRRKSIVPAELNCCHSHPSV